MKLYIFAETQRQALDYAIRNNFRRGSYDVLARPDSLYRVPGPHRVLLIGKVEKREDYEDLLEVMKVLNANVDRISTAM